MTLRSNILAMGVLAGAVLQSGCAGNLFGLNLFVVGEKTALEKQVLGTYESIGADLSTYASVRGVNPDGSIKPPPEMTDSQAAVLQAMNNRQYNRDDLNALLLGGVVGEGNDGLLLRFEGTEAPAGLSPALVDRIFEEENRDRATIIERLLRTTPGATPENRAEVAWIFATLNQELAPKGSRVQSLAGEWGTK